VVKPSQRKEMALAAVLNKAVNIRLVCQAFGVGQTCYRYQVKLCSDNRRLVRLTHNRRNWGFLGCATFTYVTSKGANGTISACTVFIVSLNLTYV